MIPIFPSYCRAGATISLAVLACGCTVPCNDAALSGAWSKELSSIRGNAILPSSDGGYLIAGSVDDPDPFSRAAIVTKVDSTGEEIWSTTFLDQDFSTARQIAPAPDGSVFISGGSDRHAHVARVDSDGTILWSRTFADDVWLGHTSAAALDDGTLALAIYTREELVDYVGETHVLKIDSGGDILWSRTLNEAKDVFPHSLVRGRDDGVVLLLEELVEDFGVENKITPVGESQVRLTHLAGDDGAISWSQKLEGELLSWATPAAPTPDGGFVFQDSDRIRRYDADGTMTWEQPVSPAEGGDVTKIHVTPDGGYIYGNSTIFRSNSIMVNDCGNIVLTKRDGEGNALWTREYGGDFLEYLQDMATTPDGGYILLGRQTRRYGSILYPVKTLIIRIDPD